MIDYEERHIINDLFGWSKRIKKNYSSKEAVKGISFNIKENEILGF